MVLGEGVILHFSRKPVFIYSSILLWLYVAFGEVRPAILCRKIRGNFATAWWIGVGEPTCLFKWKL